MLNTIGLAAEAGIPVLNMHMPEGVHFTLPDHKAYLFDIYRDDYLVIHTEAFIDLQELLYVTKVYVSACV